MQNNEFEKIGKRLLQERLLGGNFGNMSIRSETGFYITKSGSFMDEPGDLKYVSMDKIPEEGASSEWRVHFDIYNKTNKKAIIHAHPVFSVAASFCYHEIIPEDSEGKMLCPVIPVVTGEPGTDDLAWNISEALKKSSVAIAKGHGTFAAGKDLTEAYLLTSIAEYCCKIIYLRGGLGGLSP
ncbi:L-fuculose-phosphate aldolase [Methanomicrobium sp. W14]|uniref:aldolase n=1 Tax=Methanomicrobium sp. W14 TaxID=2817839 RepID=UPI001AE91E38|nr:aldolase [Methanomicrobium sp. W14]MBP2132804.1 L-fuculose-phosphate aldolase [Methanomicrobium sp. W14]